MPRPSDLSDLLIAALRSAVDHSSGTYVAGPLATGWLYYEQLLHGSPPGEDVRQVNEIAMRDFVRALRSRKSHPVIDSGVLRVSHWSPGEHGEFFLRVIAELCHEVIFLDGWEFSSGATKEFVFAKERAIPCLNSSEEPITVAQGRHLVSGAREVVRRAGGDVGVLERRLQAIEVLIEHA